MKTRIISAIVALLISVPLIIIGGTFFRILGLLISIVGLYEMVRLITDNKIAWGLSLVSFLIIIIPNLTKTSYTNIFDYNIFGIILLLFFMLKLLLHKNKEFNIMSLFSLIFSILFLSYVFSLIVITRNMSLYYFLYMFIVTLMSDTFAYFCGVAFGKHKINEISPNKSWEGVIFGTLCGTLIGSIFYMMFIKNCNSVILLFLITYFLSILGVCGDLFFSSIKRYFHIKDFSNIMPGHGGVLDRFDSVIFVVLGMTYFISLI